MNEKQMECPAHARKRVWNFFVYATGVSLSPTDYGTLWKMDGPTESCEDEPVEEYKNCGDEVPKSIKQIPYHCLN